MTHHESLPTASVGRAPRLNAVSRINAVLARPPRSATLIVSAIIWAFAAVVGRRLPPQARLA